MKKKIRKAIKRNTEKEIKEEMKKARRLWEIEKEYPDQLIERVTRQLEKNQKMFDEEEEKIKEIKEIYSKVKKGEKIKVGSEGAKKMWIATKVKDIVEKHS